MSTPSEWTPKRYRVTFDRIGRGNHPEPQIFTARNADELALLIYRFAKPKLASHDVDVALDLNTDQPLPHTGKGSIAAGFHNAGSFEIEEIL
jgi:hypothetical protein